MSDDYNLAELYESISTFDSRPSATDRRTSRRQVGAYLITTDGVEFVIKTTLGNITPITFTLNEQDLDVDDIYEIYGKLYQEKDIAEFLSTKVTLNKMLVEIGND